MIDVNDNSERGDQDSMDYRYQTRPGFTNITENDSPEIIKGAKPSKSKCVIF